MFTPAIQIIEPAKDESEAVMMLAAIRTQVDFIAGRVLFSRQPDVAPIRVQAIMETNGEYPRGWLPDGCQHVLWRGCF